MRGGGAGRRLLYFITTTQGGLGRYAREQIPALRRLGLEIDLMCPAALAAELHWDGPGQDIGDQGEVLPGCRAARRLALARRIVANHRQLAERISATDCRHVLFSAFAEYLAPLWAGRLRRAQRRGVVFGAILHDPVRDFRLGPSWWHRRSVAAAAGILRDGFVHGEIAPVHRATYPGVRLTSIPFGPNLLPPPGRPREVVRASLGIPADAFVLLSFGFIRDNKNLDLALRALPDVSDAVLVVAGGEQSTTQRPLSYYGSLAARLGVTDRCRFTGGTVSDVEAADLFAASDLVLLTYSRTFVSGSGVLTQAAAMQKPCLASGGAGPLTASVEAYRLGLIVDADDAGAIVQGIRRWRAAPSACDFAGYLRANSWERNAAGVAARLFGDD
jgi:glycosyltransferase involved in cell wall biosynthesis